MTSLATDVFSDWFGAAATRWKKLNDTSTASYGVSTYSYPGGSMAVDQTGTFNGTLTPGDAPATSAASSACVASLYTDTISRRGRGRMYFPGTGSSAGGVIGFGWDTGFVSAFCTAFAQHLAAIEGLSAYVTLGPLVPVVQSGTAGAVYDITQVQMDTRQDRQEHREKNQTYTRFQHAV